MSACDQGKLTRRTISTVFQVSESFVRRLLQRRRETGSYAARPHGGGSKPRLLEPHLEQIKSQVQKQPDIKLTELCNHLNEQSAVQVSDTTMSRALKKLKLHRKKSRCTPANGTLHAFRPCVRPGRKP